MSGAPAWIPVRTYLVLTLRDLQGVHEDETRRTPLFGDRSSGRRQHDWWTDAVSLLGCALDWRRNGTEEELRALDYFLRDVARWMGGDGNAHLPIYGADLVLSATREPA